MQRREESVYPGDWLRIAEKDLERVERYPFVSEIGPTEEDVRGSLERIGDLVERLRRALRRP